MENYSATYLYHQKGKKKKKKNIQMCEVGQLWLEDMMIPPIATLLSLPSSTHSSKPDTSAISSPSHFLPTPQKEQLG